MTRFENSARTLSSRQVEVHSSSIFNSNVSHLLVSGRSAGSANLHSTFPIDPIRGNALHEKIKSGSYSRAHDELRTGFFTNLPPLSFSEYGEEVKQALLSVKVLTGQKRFRDIDIEQAEPVRSHLRRFYLALDGYLESANPVMTPLEIIDLVNKGPDGISICKKIRSKSLVLSTRSTFMEQPEWFNDLPAYQINDIGDVFNYQYLIDWELPDEEDYKYGLIPCHIKAEHLAEFKTALRDFLPPRESFDKVDPDEILLSQSSSVALDASLKKGKHWRLQGLNPKFDTNGLSGKRTIVHTGPGSDRDTVILPINKSNTIKLIDRQVLQILAHMSGNGMFSDPIKIEQKLVGDRKKFNFFLNRDLKKEGLTKPRELCTAILEVLSEEYPDLDLDRYISIYDHYELIVDDQPIRMKRGHGLGMANSLTTMMQLGVFYMIQHRMLDEGFSQWDRMGCRAYNDDFYAAFYEEEDSWLYHEHETDVFEDLSLIRESRKSWMGPESVLCEIYSQGYNRKESYARREILLAMACNNIVQAKAYINSLDKSFNPDILEEYIDEIIDYWGYEFCPCERKLPTSAGGWLSFCYRLVSDDCSKLSGVRHLKACYEAAKHDSLRIRVDKSKLDDYIAPIETLFRITELPEEAAGYFNIDMPKSIKRRFTRISSSPIALRLAYRELLDKRQRTYGHYIHEYEAPDIIEKDLINRFPLIDFLPNSSTYERETIIRASNVPVEHTWEHLHSANPRIAYLKYLYPDKFGLDKDHIFATPIPLLIGSGGMVNLDTRSYTLHQSRHIQPQERLNESPVAYNKYMLYTEDSEFNNNYLNPEAVCLLIGMKGCSAKIPTVVPATKRSLIELQRKWKPTIAELEIFWQAPSRLRSLIRMELGPLEDDVEIVAEVLKEALYTEPEPVKYTGRDNDEDDDSEETSIIGEEDLGRYFIEYSEVYKDRPLTPSLVKELEYSFVTSLHNRKFSLVLQKYRTYKVTERVGITSDTAKKRREDQLEKLSQLWLEMFDQPLEADPDTFGIVPEEVGDPPPEDDLFSAFGF
jgi:hypothetical protein